MCVKDVRVSKYTSTLTLSSRTHTVTHELIQINKQQKGIKSKKKNISCACQNNTYCMSVSLFLPLPLTLFLEFNK